MEPEFSIGAWTVQLLTSSSFATWTRTPSLDRVLMR
jgi:hypothetical protein